MVTSMKTLNLKVIRDIKAKKGMFLAVTFLVFLGVAIFSSFYMSYLNLKNTYNYFYEQTNFEDISIDISKAPKDVIKKIKKIDGVKDVEGRISIKGSTELQNQHIVLRLISVGEIDKETKIDKLIIVGEYLESKSVLLLKKFANYHNIGIGDYVHVKIGGKKIRLRVSGLAYSPEYIWVVEGGELLTSPRTFGVAFVPHSVLEEFGYKNTINQVKITVYDNQRKDEILKKALSLLKNYGITNYYTSENQPSNKALQMDLDGFKQLAILFPSFFLLISIFGVYILLTRLIKEQINSIAVLRALGISRQTVLKHYLKHSLFIGVAGSMAGVIVGYLMAVMLTVQYTSALNVPYYVAKPHYDIIFFGFVAGVVTPLLSGFVAANNASKVEITQALRGHVEIFKTNIDRFFEMPLLLKLSIRNLLCIVPKNLTLNTLKQLMGYGRLTERKIRYIVRHKRRGKTNR
ncbi:hypothetical protein DRP05_10785, partial [Archaeoglobales archaeon]